MKKPGGKSACIILCLCAVMALLLVAGGCAGNKKEKTAVQLSTEGNRFFEDGNYGKAVKAYKRLKDWYPYSEYAKAAGLKIADAHFKMKEYDEAVSDYEEYEKLHPSDSHIPYVIYQTGRCHYDRLTSIDRDQTPARKAVSTFTRLISRFPDSSYAVKSRPMLEKCLKNMAGHEFTVGLFYFRARHYKAASQRFLNIVTDYPDSGYNEKALEYIARCRQRKENEATEDIKGKTMIQ
ncbi:MAG: outer membrane protein assembly factor BamD [Deltaproteobacteria bacterium]|nr:outer membrane protein assembly factor BamD [Deltaproteobacteria bacterium]